MIILMVALARAGAPVAATARPGAPAQLTPTGAVPLPQTYIKSANPSSYKDYGRTLAISGGTLAIGAPQESGGGIVYVYVRVNGAWVRQGIVSAANATTGDWFGYDVALEGETLVVGAPQEDSNGSGPTNNSVSNAGAAYVFVRSNGIWVQQAFLKPSNIAADYWFGTAVDIDGDSIVVGAVGDNSTVAGGAAYVFTRAGGAWSQQGYLKASNAEQWDRFGGAVGIEGDVVVVGADGERSNGSGPGNNVAEDAGAAYIFERSGGAWSERAYIKPPTVSSYDLFGDAVAIDGGTVVVGSPHLGPPCCQRDGAAPADPAVLQTGGAFVYVRTSGLLTPTWTLQASLYASNADISDTFGADVDIDGDTIVVGASGEDGDGSSPANNTGDESGAVYVFRRGGTAWTELDYRKAFNRDNLDLFGYAVAFSGGTMAVTALHEAGNGSSPSDNSASFSGAVYVQDIGRRLSMPNLQR